MRPLSAVPSARAAAGGTGKFITVSNRKIGLPSLKSEVRSVAVSIRLDTLEDRMTCPDKRWKVNNRERKHKQEPLHLTTSWVLPQLLSSRIVPRPEERGIQAGVCRTDRLPHDCVVQLQGRKGLPVTRRFHMRWLESAATWCRNGRHLVKSWTVEGAGRYSTGAEPHCSPLPHGLPASLNMIVLRTLYQRRLLRLQDGSLRGYTPFC